MADFKKIVTFMVLSAVLAVCLGQSGQGGPHESQKGPQGRSRRQVSEGATPENDNESNVIGQNPMNWTTCDTTVIPKVSCHDCNTRVICKSIGGLLKTCNNPSRPHCNLGICSTVPSPACV